MGYKTGRMSKKNKRYGVIDLLLSMMKYNINLLGKKENFVAK